VRVIVCGGRHYGDWPAVRDELDRWARAGDSDSLVIQGGASGADALAKRWADFRGIPHIEVPALWLWHRRCAGPVRNEFMFKIGRALGVEMLVAFPGGAGTADMVARAEKAGVSVRRVEEK
jgi:hypothetical protein